MMLVSLVVLRSQTSPTESLLPMATSWPWSPTASELIPILLVLFSGPSRTGWLGSAIFHSLTRPSPELLVTRLASPGLNAVETSPFVPLTAKGAANCARCFPCCTSRSHAQPSPLPTLTSLPLVSKVAEAQPPMLCGMVRLDSRPRLAVLQDRKSTRLNASHRCISY